MVVMLKRKIGMTKDSGKKETVMDGCIHKL